MILSTEANLLSVKLETKSQSNKFEAKSSFFYSDEPFIIQMDEDQIYKTITLKYKIFDEYKTDQQLKKHFLEFLNDDIFISKVLKLYNITIFELFEVFVTKIPSIFTKNFAQKVRDVLVTKDYARKRQN